jgi:hypothetical protein
MPEFRLPRGSDNDLLGRIRNPRRPRRKQWNDSHRSPYHDGHKHPFVRQALKAFAGSAGEEFPLDILRHVFFG